MTFVSACSTATQRVSEIHWGFVMFDTQLTQRKPVKGELCDVVDLRVKLQVWPDGQDKPLLPGSNIEKVFPPPRRNEQGEAVINGKPETDEHKAAINSWRITEGSVKRAYAGVKLNMPNFQMGALMLDDLERMKRELE